jgi:hypothetical protein
MKNLNLLNYTEDINGIIVYMEKMMNCKKGVFGMVSSFTTSVD